MWQSHYMARVNLCEFFFYFILDCLYYIFSLYFLVFYVVLGCGCHITCCIFWKIDHVLSVYLMTDVTYQHQIVGEYTMNSVLCL